MLLYCVEEGGSALALADCQIRSTASIQADYATTFIFLFTITGGMVVSKARFPNLPRRGGSDRKGGGKGHTAPHRFSAPAGGEGQS